MAFLAEDEFDQTAVGEVLRIIDEGYGNKDGEVSEEEWLAAMLDVHSNSSDQAFFAECQHNLDLLQKNQRTHWRRLYRSKDAFSLVSAMRAAGVTHLLFTQHANATVSASGGQKQTQWSRDDLNCRVTNRGQAQCWAARSAWFNACPTRRTIVCRYIHISRDAHREIETIACAQASRVPPRTRCLVNASSLIHSVDRLAVPLSTRSRLACT